MALRFVNLPRTVVLSLGITAFAPTFAAAQTPSSDPSSGIPVFAQAIQGKNVWVTADGARVRGFVTSLKPAGLVLYEDGVATTIAYDNVVRVEKSTHRLRNGALIGLAAGAGLGFAAMAGICSDEYCYPSDYFLVPGFYGGLGAAAGVGIGAIIHASKKSGDVLYDARRSTKTMSLAPILSPTRKGMAFSMTWR